MNQDDRQRDESKTLWHGRFAGGPADELMAYTVSLPFDRRLWREDIACSRAHVTGLAHVGILQVAERDAVLAALDVVESEMATGSFVFAAGDEDIHTAIERRVTEIAHPRRGQVRALRRLSAQHLVEQDACGVGVELRRPAVRVEGLARVVGRRGCALQDVVRDEVADSEAGDLDERNGAPAH
ncbi:MAG: lyase family protein, partial [Ilumatobacteraceae bacterium]